MPGDREPTVVGLAPRVPTYAALGVVGLIVGLATAQPAAVALGAAFMIPLLYGLATAPPRLPASTTQLSHERLLEGESLQLKLAITARDRVDWIELGLDSPALTRLSSGSSRRVLSLRRGETRTLEYTLECPRWGVYQLGPVRIRAAHDMCLRVSGADTPVEPLVRVYPQLERLRRLVTPLATRPATGNRPARAVGEGIEFAEVRELRPGERARRINQRASSRHRRLFINDRLPERSSDIVIFLDSLTHTGTQEQTTLDFAVRAVATLTNEYLRQRDRVGLLSFGGDLEWVLPRSGPRQQYRIIEAILTSEAAQLYRWHDLTLIPRQILPPQSLILAVSPLLDWRVNRALLNLRARAYNLAVIEVDPIPFAHDFRAAYGDVAWRLWLLERERIRGRFARSGATLARWNPGEPLAVSVERLACAR